MEETRRTTPRAKKNQAWARFDLGMQLTNAVRNRNRPLMNNLLERKADVDFIERLVKSDNPDPARSKTRDISAIHLACRNGEEAIVRDLINAGADVDLRDEEWRSGLHVACEHGHVECARLLIESKAHVNGRDKKRKTSLHIACNGGRVECARLLLESKAVVDLQDVNGFTGLICAVANEWFANADCLQLMIEANADVDHTATDDHGGTGLHIACDIGHAECARLLIEANATVDLRDKQGHTQLALATMLANPECLKLLIDAKSNVNPRALLTVEYGHIPDQRRAECARLLFDNNADVFLRDEDGQTALSRAARSSGPDLEYTRVILGELASSGAPRARIQQELSHALHEANRTYFDNEEQVATLLLAGATVQDDREESHYRGSLASTKERVVRTLNHANEFHRIANNALSNDVEVDKRIGLAADGLYQEPLERVLEYLGLGISPVQTYHPDNTDGIKHFILPGPKNAADWVTRQGRTENI